MKPHRLLTALLLAAGLLAGASAQSVRPEVGKPLQQAGDLLRAGKAKEALAKVREADAVGGKTPAEQVMIDRMKGAAAQRAGDNAAAAQAFEAVFASGKLAGPEQAVPQPARLTILFTIQTKDDAGWEGRGHGETFRPVNCRAGKQGIKNRDGKELRRKGWKMGCRACDRGSQCKASHAGPTPSP